MVEHKNSIGQTLLRLERNEVKNLMGQTIGTTRDHQLVNLQGQVLAEVRDGKVYRGGDPNISFLAANPAFSFDGRWVFVEGYLNNNPTLLEPLTVKFLLFDLLKVQPVDLDSTR